MSRREQVLALLLKTFPAGSSLALKPESLELDYLTGHDASQEAFVAALYWRDGIRQAVKVCGTVGLSRPTEWVAVMKQDGAGSTPLRLKNPDFGSRRNISKQTDGRGLSILYFTLQNV